MKKKDHSAEDKFDSMQDIVYTKYEEYSKFKDLIAFGKSVVMEKETFHDGKGLFDGYHLIVEGAGPDAKFPAFLNKEQIKLCKGADMITGTVVVISQIVIENPKNIYKIEPGKAIYIVTVEQPAPVYTPKFEQKMF